MSKKTNHHKEKMVNYSFSNVLTGSDLSVRRLAIMKSAGKKKGPVVWLTGAIHGDEVGGIVIIQEVFKALKKHGLLQGTLYALPLMNPIGFESNVRGLPLSEEDLNRSFPGDKDGSIAQRIANQIFSTIVKTKPSLVMDLHNDWSASIPYTLIDPYPGILRRNAYNKVKEYSFYTGFPVIDEQEVSTRKAELEKTLSGSLLKSNIPAITLELGGAYVVDEDHVKSGIQAIWNVLSQLKMVEQKMFKEEYHPNSKTFYKGRILKYSHKPRADASGIMRFTVKPGQKIKKGQSVARVYNVFGKLQSTLISSEDGLVLGHADSSVAFPGAEIIALGI
jgi:uncharacterized protein